MKTTPSARHGFRIALFLTSIIAAGVAHAEQTYLTGTISNVTFAGDTVLVRLDTGVPGNCAGTPYGWMMVPSASKPMIGFVTGLWMRGDASSVTVTIYTDGLGGWGYCTINQLDPAG